MDIANAADALCWVQVQKPIVRTKEYAPGTGVVPGAYSLYKSSEQSPDHPEHLRGIDNLSIIQMYRQY